MQEATDQKYPVSKYKVRHELREPAKVSNLRNEHYMRYQEKFEGNLAYWSNGQNGRHRERGKACGAISHPVVREIKLLRQTVEGLQLLLAL